LEQQIAFDSLKEILAEQTLLYYPNEDLEFLLQTDASKYAIGGALMQLVSIISKEGTTSEEYRVVEYFSRSLIERERNYTVSEKEFLAIVSCVEKWKHYLWKHFKVITDHKPLLSMALTDKARLQRWALRISPYSFTLAWAPGEEMKIPDALSRDPGLEQNGKVTLHCTITPINSIEREEQEDMCLVPTSYVVVEKDGELRWNSDRIDNPLALTQLAMTPNPQFENARAEMGNISVKLVMSRVIPFREDEGEIWSITLDRLETFEEANLEDLLETLEQETKVPDIIHPGSPSFRKEQEEDPTLKGMIDRLDKENEVPGYYLQTDTGLLMKISKDRHRIVVPEQTESNLFWLYHEHPLAGHASIDKMISSISENFYLRGLREKAKKWVQNCQCMRAKARMRKKAGLTLTRPIPRLFAYLVIDLVGEFPRSRRGNIYWLTLVDAFSKDLELVALKSKSAEGIAKAILEEWVCRRGCPVALLSDNAKEFTGVVAKALCELLHLDKKTITAYQHTSAGLVENVHKYAHSIMRSANVHKLSQWDEQLKYIRFAILTHELDSCGLSPFQITYGNRPTLPGDLTTQSHVLPKSMRKYLAKAQKSMRHTRDFFRIQRQKSRIRNRLKRDRLNNRYRQVYSVGEPVYVTKPSYTRRDGVKGISKIVGPFRGPYKIVATDSHNGVDVEVEGEIMHFNVGQTANAYTLEPQHRPPPAYQGDRLVYNPEPREHSSIGIQNPRGVNDPSIESGGEVVRPPSSPNLSSAEKSAEEKTTEVLDQPTQPKSLIRGESKEISKEERKFQIVFDTVSGTYYAAELVAGNPDEAQAALFVAAKRGQYHNIWYDPNNADKVKQQKTCPKGYKPWIIPLDDTWHRIGPIQSDLKKLSRKIITQQRVINT
jgi:hypothetical protein